MTAPPIRPPLPAPFPTAVDKCSTGTVIVQLTRARVLESLSGPMTRGRPSPVCAPIWSSLPYTASRAGTLARMRADLESLVSAVG